MENVHEWFDQRSFIRKLKEKKNNPKLRRLWRVLMITTDPPSASVKSKLAHYQSSRMALYDAHHTPAVHFGWLSDKSMQ